MSRKKSTDRNQRSLPDGVEEQFARWDAFSADPITRRSFLQLAGFTLAAGVLTSCSRVPFEKAIPYLIQPEEVVPGRAYWFASVCGGCSAGCGVQVKLRDGRPIKLEGNPDHPLSRGGLCAVGQASILGLYDSHRFPQPLRNGDPISWGELDRGVISRLTEIRDIPRSGRQGKVRFLSNSVISPTMQGLIDEFLATFSDGRHVTYDPLSSSAALEAHLSTHGIRALPRCHFDRADVIVSFDADFLGTWVSPVEYAAGWTRRRDPESADRQGMSHHIQIESRLSPTGCKADERIPLAPGEIPAAIASLTAQIAQRVPVSYPHISGSLSRDVESKIDVIAQRLWQARGSSLIVCGLNDLDLQATCNYLNHLLGNYGKTLDLDIPSHQRQGDDSALTQLLGEVERGEVAALFIAGVNPVFELPDGERLRAKLQQVPLSVVFAERGDETTSAVRYVCSVPHFLSTWSDAEPVDGVVSVSQQVIEPLDDVRSLTESLAAWMNKPAKAYDLVRGHWEQRVYPRSKSAAGFERFWDEAVQRGYAEIETQGRVSRSFDLSTVKPIVAETATEDYSLVLYPKVSQMDGRQAWNPLLQELPDPVTRASWDNYACLSLEAARRLGVEEGDEVRIELDGAFIQLPAFVQPGQDGRTIAVALGYGSVQTERFKGVGPRWLEAEPTVNESGRVGVSAAPLLRLADKGMQYVRNGVKLTVTGRHRKLAVIQEHNRLDVRESMLPTGGHLQPIIRSGSLTGYLKSPQTFVARPDKSHAELWADDHKYTGHHWGMVVDLNRCIGCGACVVACQLENNIPVVGRDEVRRSRELHWLRIDRYYSGSDDAIRVAFQPMMCQQCDHAPCETVCPVLATVHSSEGLNTQVYNRCVGTRYCANNCPYKVRRFNWFNYTTRGQRENLALNPDVVVRSRGIMEKCTFCVQRIQEAKIEARRLGRQVQDGEIKPACQQSCPTGALVFGDLNQPGSRVSQLMKGHRCYRVLEELNVQPSVGYLAIICNTEDDV